MGRAGYFGCLVILGVLMVGVGCLTVFGAAGAITAERGTRAPAAAARATTPAGEAKPETPTEKPVSDATKSGAIEKPREPAAPSADAKPTPAGTPPPRSGPEVSIAQRLDREAIGGGLILRALGAAKTTQGDRSVIAIYIRIQNDGMQSIRIEPRSFKMVDRAGARFEITPAVEQIFPPVELGPKAGPGEQGKLTEGNLTFEIPRNAVGLALLYEFANGGQPLRIQLPPEFG